MSPVLALFAGGLTAGVALAMSALFETSVFGSGVNWANNDAAAKTISAWINLMAAMLQQGAAVYKPPFCLIRDL
jgi:hypothetical protein